MPTVTFTLASLPSSTAKRLRFEPRDAPWVNTSGAVVTPDGFESSYPRGAAQSITLDTGPWRVRIGLSWYPFDVPAAGGDLKDLILFGVPASAPVSTITAAVNAYLADNPVAADDASVAALLATDGDTRDGVDARVRAVGDATYANVDAYVIFRDQDGDELPEGSVVEIRVNTATSEIDDIIYTAPEA